MKIEELNAQNEKMAASGLRVLYVAMRLWEKLPQSVSPDTIEREMTFLGLTGLLDPPREEVKEAIQSCKTAGIQTVMITGDHPITARAIAERLGILEKRSQDILTGRDLE